MNPEFQRNLWLEASPRRVAWAAVVLGLIFGMVAFVTHSEGGSSDKALAYTGLLVFYLCAVFWGARAASAAVLVEIADRTWDFQRLSALTPWEMTWGKLFGATSLAWLCGLAGLLVMIAGTLIYDPAVVPGLTIFMLALAVLVQALMLAAGLIGVRKARAEGRVARSGGIFWGLVLGGFLLSAIAGRLGIKGNGDGFGLGELFTPPARIDWWGASVDGELFRAVTVTAFAAWALAGAWRLMRLELQMRNRPLVWPAFLVFLAIFTGGLAFGGGLSAALLAGGFSIVLCAYAAAFVEPADRVRFRQFLGAAGRGDLARAATLVPLWLAPALLYALLVIGALAAGGAIRPEGGWNSGPSASQGLAVFGFLARDLGVIAFFRFGPRPQRGDFGAVLALALLYSVGGLIAGSIGGETGVALFVPFGPIPFVSLASGLAQAALAWWLAAKRFRAPEAPAAAATPAEART